MMSRNKIELLRKIKALSESGVGGEKTNAESQLKKYMKKYGITEDDLEIEQKKDVRFYVTRKPMYQKLFSQVASTIIYGVEIYGTKGDRSHYIIECTPYEQIEIQTKFDFYKKRLDEDYEIFYLAFIGKNNLWPLKPTKEGHEFTEDEIIQQRKAAMMQDGLDKHHYNKQLEYGGKEK